MFTVNEVIGRLVVLLVLTAASAGPGGNLNAQEEPPPNAVEELQVERFESNPLVTRDASPTVGEDVNYPSVIKVPSWVSRPLGKYYMYFGNHYGEFIRFAYADNPKGPWTVCGIGTLHNTDTPNFPAHLASPDVIVDHEEEVFRMYFHGNPENTGQKTGLAHSEDGLYFTGSGKFLTTNYFRYFKWDDTDYAIAGSSSPKIVRSESPDTPFEDVTSLSQMRHSTVHIRNHYALVFYSRIGDRPERILMSTINLKKDPENWTLSRPKEVLKPEKTYEGVEHELKESEGGPGTDVRELRDPYVFEDDGQLYLYYSIAGESGIAGATLELEMK